MSKLNDNLHKNNVNEVYNKVNDFFSLTVDSSEWISPIKEKGKLEANTEYFSIVDPQILMSEQEKILGSQFIQRQQLKNIVSQQFKNKQSVNEGGVEFNDSQNINIISLRTPKSSNKMDNSTPKQSTRYMDIASSIDSIDNCAPAYNQCAYADNYLQKKQYCIVNQNKNIFQQSLNKPDFIQKQSPIFIKDEIDQQSISMDVKNRSSSRRQNNFVKQQSQDLKEDDQKHYIGDGIKQQDKIQIKNYSDMFSQQACKNRERLASGGHLQIENINQDEKSKYLIQKHQDLNQQEFAKAQTHQKQQSQTILTSPLNINHNIKRIQAEKDFEAQENNDKNINNEPASQTNKEQSKQDGIIYRHPNFTNLKDDDKQIILQSSSKKINANAINMVLNDTFSHVSLLSNAKQKSNELYQKNTSSFDNNSIQTLAKKNIQSQVYTNFEVVNIQDDNGLKFQIEFVDESQDFQSECDRQLFQRQDHQNQKDSNEIFINQQCSNQNKKKQKLHNFIQNGKSEKQTQILSSFHSYQKQISEKEGPNILKEAALKVKLENMIEKQQNKAQIVGIALSDFRGSCELNGLQQLLFSKGEKVVIDDKISIQSLTSEQSNFEILNKSQSSYLSNITRSIEQFNVVNVSNYSGDGQHFQSFSPNQPGSDLNYNPVVQQNQNLKSLVQMPFEILKSIDRPEKFLFGRVGQRKGWFPKECIQIE